MRLTALAIGTRMPAWVTTGVETYQQRMPRHIDLQFKEFAVANRGSNTSAAQVRRQEGEHLLGALQKSTHAVALDERGSAWTSRQLAAQLERWLAEQSEVAFLIGGADGLDERCKERAAQLWSLSSLTLPHALVRVVLAEQLYRAWTLIQGHPYHRE